MRGRGWLWSLPTWYITCMCSKVLTSAVELSVPQSCGSSACQPCIGHNHNYMEQAGKSEIIQYRLGIGNAESQFTECFTVLQCWLHCHREWVKCRLQYSVFENCVIACRMQKWTNSTTHVQYVDRMQHRSFCAIKIHCNSLLLTGSENMVYTLLAWLVQVLQMSHCPVSELVEELQWSDFK